MPTVGQNALYIYDNVIKKMFHSINILEKVYLEEEVRSGLNIVKLKYKGIRTANKGRFR